MSLIPTFNNGHGGVIKGVYQTPGKRSPKWDKGTLFEGMFNRWVVNRLIEKCDREQIPYFHLCPELTDIGLGTRKNRANKISQTTKNTYLLEIHANAGGGTGVEGFTTVGKTKSDTIAEEFLTNLKEDLSDTFFRVDTRDGDMDKEKNYFMLAKVSMPAFLLECGFMDRASDYNNMWDEDYLNSLVNSLFRTVKELYNK